MTPPAIRHRRDRTSMRSGMLLIVLWLSATAALAQLAAHDNNADESVLARCHAMDDVGEPNARACYLDLLGTEGDDAVRGEALWRLGNMAGANRAFRRAAQTQPGNADVRAQRGQLFLAAHQAADAQALFSEALKIEPANVSALLGMAELQASRFEGPVQGLIGEVLRREPANPRANVLLARLYLEVGDSAAARRVLLDLLEVQDAPRARLDAYALLAAVDHVAGELPSPWTSKALELNPRFADIYAVPAYFYVITRRYVEAVALLEQAAQTDPAHWGAHSDLGINLLRLNRFTEAREHLEQAYAGDPFNAEVVNTLRLLDSLSNFDTLTSDNLILRVHKSETSLLAPYVRELVNNTEHEMAARYGYKLERPVVIELYQHHDDFAVRTAGLPGLGILGATFGDVVVMDGPSAKRAEEFDWISAVWHELAHVITLNATDNLVSRWFSEGVSVFEEWRYGPSPSESVAPHFLEALQAGRLLPVANLDEGFIRPTYPAQIGVSYLQAGLLCTFIADNFANGLRDILDAYRAGATTVEAIELALAISPGNLDAQFANYMDERFGSVIANLVEFKELRGVATKALAEERWQDAQAAAQQAVDIYPAYIGPTSPYLLVARAAADGEQPELALAALAEYWQRGGRNPGALQKLALAYQAAGQPDAAIAVQSVLVRAAPLVAEHHATLGDWSAAARQHEKALGEYRAVLALLPHDRASAHFHVANSLHELNRIEEARRELLYALEIAPRFAPALSLLVEINQ